MNTFRVGGYEGDIVVNRFHMHAQEAKTHPGRWLVRAPHNNLHPSKQLRAIGTHPEHYNHKQYHWVAISTPLGIDLLVLAKDAVEFHTTYASYVEQWLAQNGFRYSFNTPRTTKHDGHACHYEEMWRKKEMSYGSSAQEDQKAPKLIDIFTNFPNNLH